jgi:hypothetical protein
MLTELVSTDTVVAQIRAPQGAGPLAPGSDA